jgi:hypothetical protein
MGRSRRSFLPEASSDTDRHASIDPILTPAHIVQCSKFLTLFLRFQEFAA